MVCLDAQRWQWLIRKCQFVSHPSPGSVIFAFCFQCPQTVDGSAVAWDGVAGQNVSVVKCQDLGADGYTYADPISSYTFTWSPAPVAASPPSSPSSYVWRMVSVPYSRADFTHAKQDVFIRAVAAVAGAQVSDLDISTISEYGSGSIQFSVRARNSQTLADMRTRITPC